MMATIQIPGVYREAVRLPPRPSLSSGVPVFLGIGEWALSKDEGVPSPGPPQPEENSDTAASTDQEASEKRTLTGFTRFEDFDDAWIATTSYLTAVIQGFFINGGKLCYVLPMKDNEADTLRQSLEQLQEIDDIDLVCAPDLIQQKTGPLDPVVAKQTQILEHCALMGDRFAILDGVRKTSQLTQQRQRLRGGYGALYFPWLSVLETASQKEYVPPCGHVAGIYARSDGLTGVHKAPANEVLEGVSGLELEVSSKDQINLNTPQNQQGSINFILQLRGRGIRVWGARTLSPEPEWRYINVRRLVIAVKRWLDYHLQEIIFEPNTPDLWEVVKRDVSAYLSGLWQQGALRGADPEVAFYVKCDGETNPVSVRDAGQLVVEIGLAPVEPGEFIRVKLVQSAGGSTLEVV